MSTNRNKVDLTRVTQSLSEYKPAKKMTFLSRVFSRTYLSFLSFTVYVIPFLYLMLFTGEDNTISVENSPVVIKANDESVRAVESDYQKGSGTFDIFLGIGGSGEQIVNTYITLDQTNPVIASFADSSYLVVWDSDGQDGSGTGIYAQRFDVDDNTIGGEFLVSGETANSESKPAVSTFSDGGFVIAWKDIIPLSHAWPEFRVFNADATPATGEINLKPTATDGANEGYNPAVLALDATRFIAVWKSENASVKSMEGQIYNRSGVAISGILPIGTLQGNHGQWAGQPSLTLLDNGGFAVSWYDNDDTGSNPVSRLRFFDSSGMATSTEIALAGDGHTAVTKLLNGNVAVTYGDNNEISAAIYTELGVLVTSEFQVNTRTDSIQAEPSVTYLEDGGFYVAWQSEYGDSDSTAVLGQRLDSLGNLRSVESLLNLVETGEQAIPELTTLADGTLRVVWSSDGQDTNGKAVVADQVNLNNLDPDICYAIGDGSNGAYSHDVLYTINVTTKTIVTIGPTSTYRIESMALDPVAEIIYACNGDTVGVVNPTTGVFTPFANGIIEDINGALGTIDIGDIDGLTFDTITNILWATERESPGNDLLFQIDPANGQFIANAFGAGVDYLEIITPELDLDDVAFGPDGTLYGISNDGSSGNQRLGSINKATGAYAEIGDYGIQDVEGLTFTNSGQLLGTTGDGGDDPNVFFTLDPTTAEFAYLTNLSPAIDVEACACRHSPFVNGIIGDFVWADIDSNGNQDPGEPGVENVQINLLDKNGAPHLDGMGAPVTTTTDVYGFYQFAGLPSDSFIIEVVLPSGASFTTQDVGVDDVDSDVNTSTGRSDKIGVLGGLIKNNTDVGLLNADVTIRTCADGGDLLVADGSGNILRFNQSTGLLIDTFIIGLTRPMEMIIGPDNYLYISDEDLDEIRRYSLITGTLIDVFATGLDSPNGLAFGADGNLYVNNRSNDEVLYFDITTGNLIGSFVSGGEAGLDSNKGGLEFGPDGNLYITSGNTNQVLRYNGATGVFIDTFVVAGSGGLASPKDLHFGSDGHLYVAASGGDKVLRYDGATGTFIDEFVAAGSGGLDNPYHFVFGSDNNIYASGYSAPTGIYRYNGTTGVFIDLFSTGLTNPEGLYFAPVPGCPEICNNNIDDDLDGLVDCLDSDCPTPALVINGNSAACVGDTLTLQDDGDEATTWNWTGPNGFTSNVDSFSIENVTAIQAGVYYVTITDGGCPSIDSITVVVNPTPTANATANTPICEGGNLLLNEDGGDAVSWNWTGPSGASSNSQSFGVGNVDSDNAGTYSVTVTDANGCTAVSTVDVTVNSEPATTAGSNSAICVGDDLNLTETGGVAVGWSWSGPNSFTSTAQNPTISAATALAAGNYTVTVTDTNGCTGTSITNVTINATPTANATANTPICEDGNLLLNEDGGDAVSWNWTGPSGASSNSQSFGVGNVDSGNGGTYSVTITDSNGCTAVSTVDVTVNSEPTVTAGSNSAICVGEDLNLTESGGAAASWSWTGPNSFTSTAQNPTISAATALAAGNYTVTITDANSCTATSTISVSLSTGSAAVAGSNGPICIGEDLNLTESGGGAISWSWSGPNGFTSTDQNPTINSVTALADGDYMLTITNASSCISFDTVDVDINVLPSLSLVFTDDEDCINNTIFLLDGGTPAGGTYSGTGVSGGNFNATAAGLGEHIITYSFTDINGCTNTTTDTINVINVGTGSLALPIEEACISSTTLALSNGTPSGGTYSGTGVTGTNFDASSAGAGVHEITYTFLDVNGCENTATDNIIVHPLPVVDLDFSDKEDCILNSTFALTEGAPTGGTYSGTGVSGTNFDASAAGLGVHYITYSVTDGNGCTNTDQDSIIVVNIPSVSLALPTKEVCISSTTLLLDGGSLLGGTFSGTGVTATNFDASAAGAGKHYITYSFTDANGCNNSAIDSIEVYANPVVSGITTGNPSSCGGTNGSILITASGGTGSFEYRLNGGSWQGSNNFTGLGAGNYALEIRNDNGFCSFAYDSNPILLTDPSSPTAEINLPASECIDQSADFVATDAGVGASYDWDFGSGATSATATGIGPHSVSFNSGGTKSIELTVTLAGCIGTDTESFSVFDNPVVSLVLPDIEECVSSTTLTLSNGSPSPGTFSGTGVTGTNFDASVAGVGTHTITYTYADGNGCENTATDDIEVLALPALTFTLGTDETCISNISLVLNGASPGGGTYSGIGVTGTNFNATTAGAGTHIITYTFTDGKGCANSITDQIEVYDFPTIDNVLLTDPSTCGGSEGTINVTASGGTGTFEYRLDSGSWQSASSFSGLTAGDYVLRVRNQNGFCERVYSSTITLSDPPATIVSTAVTSDYTGEDISCVGESDGFAAAVGSGGLAPYNYVWSDGQTGDTLRNVLAGTYTVTVTDTNGCQGVGTITLNDPPPLGVTAIFTNPTCYGDADGAIDVTATGGVGAYTYAWNDLDPEAFYPFDGATDDISGNDHHAISIIGNETYSTDAVDGDFSFDFDGSTGIKLDDGTFLDIPFSQRTVLMHVKVPPGNAKYMLYEEGGNQNGIALAIKNGNLRGAVASGGFKRTAFNMPIPQDGAWHEVGFIYDNGAFRLMLDGVEGSTVYTGFTTIAINSVFNTNDAGLGRPFGNTAFGSESFNPLIGLMDNVAIFNGAFSALDISDTGIDDGDRTGLAAGDYKVYVYDLNGCIDSVILTLTQPDSLALTTNITNVLCNGQSNGAIDLEVAGGTGPFLYNWSNGSSFEDISSLPLGNYSVTVTDINLCTVEGTFAVNEPPVLSSTVAANLAYGGYSISCVGASNGSANATPAGGAIPYTYLWSNGQTTSNLTSVAAGSYTVTITDANGCTTENSITLNDPPAVTVTTSVTSNYGGADISCAGAADGSARVTPVTGVLPFTSFIWSNGATGNNITNLLAGTYYVTATDGNGCTTLDSITLIDPASTTVTTSVTSDYNGADISCAGATDGSADVTATPIAGRTITSYIWSNTQTGTTLTGVGAGTYTVTVTDSENCSVTETVTLSNPLSLAASITKTSSYNGAEISCAGGGDGTANAVVTGGVAPYTYAWTNGETTSSVSNFTGGAHELTVTDINGCTTTATTSFSEPTAMTLTALTSPPTDCGLTDGIILMTATGGVGTYEYSLDGVTYQPSNVFLGLGAGTYFGYVRNTFGTCATGPVAMIVEIPEAPTIDNITVINPTTTTSTDGGILVNASGELTIVIEYSLDGVSWQPSNLFTGLDIGTYNVYVRYTNSVTCISSATVTLVEGGGVVGSGGGESFCSGDQSGVNFVETYYIPFPEDQILNSISTVWNTSCGGATVSDPVSTYISIGIVEDGTILYYDHWEDTFEVNLSFPVQSTTEIWGDGIIANGIPPGYAVDVLNAADIIVLDNEVVSTTRQGVIDFDGGDKIGSRGNLSITRLGWTTGPNIYLAGALEVYSTNFWGTDYKIPVGENSDVNDLFEYTGAVIMAKEDNTTINIDLSPATATTVNVTIDEGESYLVNGGLGSDGSITSDKDVQVHLITGDVCHSYESRWFTLKPTESWSDSYFNPVATVNDGGDTHIDFVNAPTYVHLYNPNPGMIRVEYESKDGYEDFRNINGGQTAFFEIDNNTGTHFYTPGNEVFYAIATIDSDEFDNNARNDWGFALSPESSLSPQITLVGFAPGANPKVITTENSAPVWITADYPTGSTNTVDITVCIDYNGDGGATPDLNGIFYDTSISLAPLENEKIFDPDGDQTGMRLWVCDGSDAIIAGAWGQDPVSVGNESQAVDLGVALPNGIPFAAAKCVDLSKDYNSNGLFDECDEVIYSLEIRNSGVLPLSIGSLNIIDTLPSSVTYIENSTSSIVNGVVSSMADDGGVSTPFPLDETGFNYNSVLQPGDSLILQFEATINDIPSAQFVSNQAYISSGALIITPEVSFPVEDPTGLILAGVPPDTTVTCGAVSLPPAIGTEIYPTNNCEDIDTIPQAGWSLHYVSSEEIAVSPNAATNAFDDVPSTFWHSQYSGPIATHPHEIQIDLGAVFQVTGFQYLPNQASANGRIEDFDFYATQDTLDWGSAQASGSWTDGVGEEEVVTNVKFARYIRLVANSEVNGNPFASVAELNILQCVNHAQDTIIFNEVSTQTSNGSATDDCYELTRTWEATDHCGEVSTYTQNITVIDTLAPQLFNIPASISVTPSTIPDAPLLNCSGPGNLALAKPVTQSSTAAAANPERAIDGNTNGNFALGSVSQTNNEFQPWWEIDLQTVSDIADIEIWNRTDCCAADLSNYFILISDFPFASTDLTTTLGDPNVTDFFETVQAGNPTTISIDTTARYVRIQLQGTAALNLTEIVIVPTCITASDNCDADVAVTFLETTSSLACAYTITRTWTATDNCGNVTTRSQDILIDHIVETNASITSDYNGEDISCAGASDGTAEVVVSGSTPPVDINWSNGQTTTTATGLSAGTYYVTISDGNGCVTQDSVVLQAPPPITISATITSDYNGSDVSCLGATDGSANVIATGGVGTLTYAWDNGGSTTNIVNLASGKYVVIVTDINGCVAMDSVTLVDPTPVDVTATVTSSYNGEDISCPNENDGSAEATGNGGTGAVNYSWSNSQTTNTISNLVAGDYIVTASDANGCFDIDTITLTDPTIIVSSITAFSNPTLCEGTDGTITAAASGGSGTYQYRLNAGAWQNSNTFTGLTAGSYDVYVRNSDGTCEIAPRTVVLVDVIPQSCPIITDTLTYCHTNTAVIIKTIASPDATAYTWTVPVGTTIVSGQGTDSIVVDLDSIAIGSYNICMVTNSNCGDSPPCCISLDLISCTEICDNGIDDDQDGLLDCADPDCSYTASINLAANECAGSATSISTDSLGDISSYTWGFGMGASPATAIGFGPHDVTYASSGVKYVTVDVILNGCTLSLLDSITINNCSADMGDFVWEDLNEDGIQNGSESGIEGVTVSLYDASNNFIANTTTASDGSFVFSSVGLGTYYLVFDVSTNTPGITMYKGTLQEVGSPLTDSDPNPATGRTSLFLFDPSLGNILTLDAGFILSCPPSQSGGINIIRR